MHIVDHERRRRLVGEVGDQPVEGVEMAQGGVRGGAGAVVHRPVAEQQGHAAGGALEEMRSLGRVDGRDERLEELANDS
jgi:hypothetical protein